MSAAHARAGGGDRRSHVSPGGQHEQPRVVRRAARHVAAPFRVVGDDDLRRAVAEIGARFAAAAASEVR
ncbi:MAG: hypothetical protein R2713_04175 [Ilumatobacteraceae bacterium]